LGRADIERNRGLDDPATPEDSTVIHHAVKTVLMAIRQARKIVYGVRVSNETQDALDALERARHELDRFIRRED
jgi:hypothetical protein